MNRHFRRSLLGAALAGAVALVGCQGDAEKDPAQVDPLDALSPAGHDPDVMRIGVTPVTGADTVRRFAPLVDYLADAHQIRAEIVVAPSYGALGDVVADRSVDAAIFSPLAYVKARRTIPAVSIATATRAGSPTYLGYLVAVPTEVPQTLADLRGKRVAWVSDASTSGYLYPRAMIRARGFDPTTFFGEERYAGDHEKALQLLKDGEVDVAAVASPFVDPSVEVVEGGSSFAVVAKTDRIPFDAVVVHKSIAREPARRLRDALLSLDQDAEASAEIAKSSGLGGFVSANEARYDVIDDVLAAERAATSVR